ncbi:MAG: ABC transporter permease [Hoeflea sp.]|uniref:ABC transporter permease n=1 Tax=Hoeflea sp. TaxID=1940281 RepID=UPI0032EE242E
MFADLKRYVPLQVTFILISTGLLFLVSPFLAPGSTSTSALLTVMAFAAILAVAAIGQTLVIQQGGLDLSTPGAISLAAVIVSQFPGGDAASLWIWIPCALAAGAMGGAISGFAITRMAVTPLVATLSMNAVFYGTVFYLTAGRSAAAVPAEFSGAAVGRTWGVPSIAILALVVVLIVEFYLRATVAGRRFLAAGANPRAARAAGIRVLRYKFLTYVAAGFFSALAGVILAGYMNVPSLLVGRDYLLPVIAVVVLGGTPLTGGAGSVFASAVGAVFLIQLQQITIGMGASIAAQFIIQAGIILLGMSVMLVPWRKLLRRSDTPRISSTVQANHKTGSV